MQKMGVESPICNERMTLYGSGMRVGNYSFSFTDGFINSGYAHFTGYFSITKLEDDGMSSFGIPMLHLKESSGSLMERASRMKYAVTTNNVYQLATNYLVALEIDQNAFEKKNPLTVEQSFFHSDRGLVPSPLIYAYWGKPALRDHGSNGLAFKISAVSGELLELNVGNASTCKGLPLIKDLNKLLTVSDEEFLKMSSLDKSNLVIRFANTQYLNSSSPKTNAVAPAPQNHKAAKKEN